MIKIYRNLFSYFGPQGWWPINGVYDPLKKTFSDVEKFEIMAGAILTQNTSWGNVEKALDNLRKKDLLSPAKIAGFDLKTLEKLIHPSGFYRQKALRLKDFSKYIVSKTPGLKNITREELLSVKGVGPETADSILLYAFEKPYFIADAYTRRFAARLGILKNGNYESTRAFFEKHLPKDAAIYKEFHALIVALAKRFCKKNPLCAGCPVMGRCRYRRSRNRKDIKS